MIVILTMTSSFLDSPGLHCRNNCSSTSYIFSCNESGTTIKSLVFTFKSSAKTQNKTKLEFLKPKFSIFINWNQIDQGGISLKNTPVSLLWLVVHCVEAVAGLA